MIDTAATIAELTARKAIVPALAPLMDRGVIEGYELVESYDDDLGNLEYDLSVELNLADTPLGYVAEFDIQVNMHSNYASVTIRPIFMVELVPSGDYISLTDNVGLTENSKGIQYRFLFNNLDNVALSASTPLRDAKTRMEVWLDRWEPTFTVAKRLLELSGKVDGQEFSTAVKRKFD